MVFSLDIERSALGGLLRNSEVFYEIDAFISENDLYNSSHKTIYSVIKNCLIKQEKIDKVLIAEKIKSLGIKFSHELDICDYLDNISFSPITAAQTLKYFKELSLYRVRREIYEIGEKLKETVKVGEFSSFNDIIAKSDAIYNQTIKNYSDIDSPINIFEDIFALVEERGLNPKSNPVFLTPFTEYNNLYGGLRPKNIYAFAARAGQGKSTLLNSIAFGCHQLNPKIKVLYLDTEMSLEEVQMRHAASISGVPIHFIESGDYRRNQEMLVKVRGALSTIKNQYQFYHYTVANKSIDEIVSIIRRFYYSKVGRGNDFLVCFDYIKMGGTEKANQSWAEHQIIGSMVDKLKRIAEEVNAPILTAIQQNRGGEAAGKTSIDDSSSFALSDRLQWFASYTGIFRAKTLEEKSADGAEFGTHKLLTTKSRHQGPQAAGFSNSLKRKLPDGSERYVSNYLNFDVINFKVTEKGSLKDIISRCEHDYQFNEDEGKKGGKLLD